MAEKVNIKLRLFILLIKTIQKIHIHRHRILIKIILVILKQILIIQVLINLEKLRYHIHTTTIILTPIIKIKQVNSNQKICKIINSHEKIYSDFKLILLKYLLEYY
jgi:hypothetical protein